MSRICETQVYILAAGLQSRYGQGESKLMAKVQGNPIFSYTMRSVLSNFDETDVTIISSNVFPDLNDYIALNYPCAKLIIDPCPGSGSANSLRCAEIPAKNLAFVTEGNIYYEDFLVYQMYQYFVKHTELMGLMAVTDKVDAAKTHASVLYENNRLTINRESISAQSVYKNMGVYFFSSEFWKELEKREHNDIIDVLLYLNLLSGNISVYQYHSTYLHMENPNDISIWENNL
jgi:choline kinase